MHIHIFICVGFDEHGAPVSMMLLNPGQRADVRDILHQFGYVLLCSEIPDFLM